MNAIQRYEQARERMVKDNRAIPPQVLRDYLDAIRAIRRNANGLHTKVIIITRNSSAELLNLFRTDSVSESGTDIEVRS